jgi:autotransporter-associated beta strand protein
MLLRFGIRTHKLIAITVLLIGSGPAAAQTFTWTKAAGTTDWNTNNNWAPATGFPNSATADIAFDTAGVGIVNISSSIQAHTLTFTNPTGNYTMTSNVSQTLSGLTSIAVGAAATGTEGINLTNTASGSLVFSGTTPTITNNSSSSATTLDIGTVIGSNAHFGLTVAGTGVTRISGSFASSVNNIFGGLTKSGPGTLLFTGSGAALSGGLNLTGGTLQLDYTATSPTSKWAAGGGLTLAGGVLSLVANTTTPFTQTNSGGTTILAGHTDVVATSAGGGTLTLALGTLTLATGATLDVSTGAGSPTFSATTSSANVGGLLGGGRAFASFGGGATWAKASGGAVAGLTAADYGTNTFTSGTNVDVTTSSSQNSFTANSLRFNTAGVALTLSGTNVIQSGGILVTPISTGGTITGGTLRAANFAELLVHQYGAGSFTINSDLASTTGGLFKTGPGTLTLGGNNIGLTAAINVHRGSLTITTTAAVNSVSQINFNDNRMSATPLQTFTVDLGDGVYGFITPPIRLSAFSAGGGGTLFSTGNSQNSRIDLNSLLSSAPGLTTPIRFGGSATSEITLGNSSNSFTGNVTLAQGFLGIFSDGVLGNATNTLTLDVASATAGGLDLPALGAVISHPIIVNSTSRIICNGQASTTLTGTVTSGFGAQLVKAGTGQVNFSGTGTALMGGLTLSGGTLELDYSTNPALKLGGGALTLNGGILLLNVNTTTPVTQNVPGGTSVAVGHTDVRAFSAGGGTLALGLGPITRSAGATFDVGILNNGLPLPTFTVPTTTGNTNGLLGTGPAFATVGGGSSWAKVSGGGVTGLVAADYGANAFTPGTNVDVTSSATLSGFTANSLRFNGIAAQTLTLSGTNTLQSGGILVPPTATGGTITGGTLTAPGLGELIVHQYGGQLTIDSSIVSTVGLTQTGGANRLVLGGNNTGLTGPINVNRGALIVTNPAAVNSANQINFNDNQKNNAQAFSVGLGNGVNGTITPPIRIGGGSVAERGIVMVTELSQNSRVTLSGLISSAPGRITPIDFSSGGINTSGFNLTNAGNSFTGDVTLSGGFLGIPSDAVLGNPANTLILNITDTITGGLEFLNGGVTVSRPVRLVGTSRIVSNGTDSNTITGPITSIGGGLVKDGTGTLTLTNSGNTANTPIGVSINAGTLAVGANGQVLPAGAQLVLNPGGQLNLGTFSNSAATAVGALIFSGGTLRVPAGAGNYFFNSLFTNSPGGTVDLTGASGFTLHLTGGGITFTGISTWLGSGAQITNDTNGTANISVNGLLTNGIPLVNGASGFGYRVTGGGTLALTGTGHTASLTVDGATLSVDNAAALSSLANLTLTNTGSTPGTLLFNLDLLTDTARNITLGTGGGTIKFQSSLGGPADLRLAGTISDSPAGQRLTVLGNGQSDRTVTLAGTNTYTGPTFIENVTVSVATLPDGGTPGPLGASSAAAANLFVGSIVGSGALRYTGPTATTNRGLTAGFLGDTVATGTVEVTNPATVLTVGGQVGGFFLVKTGPGTLVLINGITGPTPNTVAGANVSGGTLSLGATGALPAGARVAVGIGAMFTPGMSGNSPLAPIILDISGGTFRVANAPGLQFFVNQVNASGVVGGGTLDFTAAGGATLMLAGAGPAITVFNNSTWLSPGDPSAVANLNLGEVPISISPGATLTNGLALKGGSPFRLTGGGTLFQNADATAVVNMTAPITVAQGRFRVTDASSNGGVGNLGTGQFTLDGGTFAYGGPTDTTSKTMTLTSAGGTIEVESAAATLTATGKISSGFGALGLTKVGPGALALANGTNSFTSLTVNAGAVQTAADNTLGLGPVTVAAAGTLRYTGNTTSARTFNLNFGTLAAAAGTTVTLNGATVNGGFVRGPGAFNLTGGAALNGVTTQNNAVLNQTGAAAYINVSNGGALTVASPAATPAVFTGFANQGSGTITVNASSAVNAEDFQTYGTLTINPATLTQNFSQTTLMSNTGTTPLSFNGGSRTFLGMPATAVFPQDWPNVGQRGQPTFVAGIDLNGKNAIVAGGLFVNNGYVEDSSNGFTGTATVVADFGSLVKGAGFFQNSVLTVNGGKFQAGNSPGKATFGNFVLGPGGVANYVFAIDDATGVAGPAPDTAGHVSGWGLVKSIGHLTGVESTTGDFVWTATPADRLTVSLQTLVNPTTVGIDLPGMMDHFDPMIAYSWPAVTWSGSYAGPADAATLDAATAFDTTGFANPMAGRFGWQLDAGGHSLSMTYSPTAVPEPGTIALVGLAALPLICRVYRPSRERRYLFGD